MIIDNFIVKWRYFTCEHCGRKYSECIITKEEEFSYVQHRGMTVYNPNDAGNPFTPYLKVHGRVYSFLRALKNVRGKVNREKLWEKFCETSPKSVEYYELNENVIV